MYDGTTTATLSVGSATLLGAVSGDTVTLNTSAAIGTFANKNASANKTVTVAGLTIACADSANYLLSQPATTASITPKVLTVTGTTAVDKVYDGTRAATLNVSSGSLVGLIPNHVAFLGTSGVSGSFADKNEGTNKSVTVVGLTITGGDATNYTVTQPTTSASISAKSVTVLGISAPDKVYDGTTVATLNLTAAQVQGIISGDVASLGTSGVSGSFSDKNVGQAKSVTITGLVIAGSDAANYALTQPTTSASINPRTISVAGITAVSKTYDGTASAALNLSTATLQGTVAGDTVAIVTTQATGSFSDKNVGAPKIVTIAGITLSGTDAGNYAVTQPTASADITPKTLSVIVKVNSKTYDGTPAATIASESLTGVVGPDGVNLAGGSAAFSDKIAGTGKTVTVTGLGLSGADAANYSISTPVQVTADILQRVLHVTATGASKVYDGTSTGTVTLHDDRINGDVLTDAYASAIFGDKSVGAAKTITVSGITISGTDMSNYTLANTIAAATADITARPLTVSATADDKIFDGSNVAVAHLSDNRIAGDSLADAYTEATFSGKSVGTVKPVSIMGISISGIDAGNYSLSSTSATATSSITARPLHISAAGQPRKYDGTNIATVTLSDDRLPGDAFTEIYTSASFADKNVGAAKTVSVTGILITGTTSLTLPLPRPLASRSVSLPSPHPATPRSTTAAWSRSESQSSPVTGWRRETRRTTRRASTRRLSVPRSFLLLPVLYRTGTGARTTRSPWFRRRPAALRRVC